MTRDDRPPEHVVGDVAERLIGYVRRYEEKHDNRAVFAYLYLQLTRSLATGLAVGDPPFHDPAWVASLADALAAEYFSASDAIDEWVTGIGGTRQKHLTSCDLPDVVPKPWRDVYAAISGTSSYVLEDALFSMMAHISYDLPIALRRLSKSHDVRVHIADFHRMNDVLGIAIDFVQGELAKRYSSFLANLDRIFARDDELLSNYGIRLSRGMAWYNFNRLTDPVSCADAQRSIETSTGAYIQRIREPSSWPLRTALYTARFLIYERRRWPPASEQP
jgi:hypothetical protein